MTSSTVMAEGIRLSRASERLYALMEPLMCVSRMVGDVRKAAPELDPELLAIEGRLEETVGHIRAAMAVLSAKGGLL